jgi:hypothetical protein
LRHGVFPLLRLFDIAYSIMDRKKLDKCQRELEALRRGQQKARKLQALAKKLGRKKVKRGKEPTWESDLPGCYPLSIPDHGGKDIPPGTCNSILDQLEGDIIAHETTLSSNGHAKH